MMKNTVLVSGSKPSKGEYEGRSYDSTKVYVLDRINPESGGCGFAGTEYNWGTSENYKKIAGLEMYQAEVTFDIVTSGKKVQMIVMDVKPLDKGIPATSKG